MRTSYLLVLLLSTMDLYLPVRFNFQTLADATKGPDEDTTITITKAQLYRVLLTKKEMNFSLMGFQHPTVSFKLLIV